MLPEKPMLIATINKEDWIVLESSIDINAPLDAVTTIFHDPANLNKIMPMISEIEFSDGYPEVGGKLFYVLRVGGVRMNVAVTRESSDKANVESRMMISNRKFVSNLGDVKTGRAITGRTTWRFEAIEGGTRARSTYEYERPRNIPERIVERSAVRTIGQRSLRNSLINLRRLAEEQPKK
jgi:carbon monoxide dehydrogenase subunit G